MASAEKSLDRWELAREEARIKVQSCQKEHAVKSCMACDKVLGCEIRADYVKKVYESMSKGQGGGFEF
jgi:coenzyme F420-reducing hydrogenase alpha subunit